MHCTAIDIESAQSRQEMKDHMRLRGPASTCGVYKAPTELRSTVHYGIGELEQACSSSMLGQTVPSVPVAAYQTSEAPEVKSRQGKSSSKALPQVQSSRSPPQALQHS
eukprot:6462127-Amphidinium_carterae.1